MISGTPCNGNRVQDPSGFENSRRCRPRPNNGGQSQLDSNSPYDFDICHCKIVDDRVLCGYNKNIGKPESKNSVVGKKGDCTIRGGRIECGYMRVDPSGPADPPGPADAPGSPGSVQLKNRFASNDYPDNSPMLSNNQVNSEDRGRHTNNPLFSVPRCVEIDNRIVCNN